MANAHTNHRNLAPLLLVFLLLTSSSHARLLNDFAPAFNLALPSDRVLPKEDEPAMTVAGKIPSAGMRFTGGKYGPMILNMLPKGTKVPPSGPSKGSNDFNN